MILISNGCQCRTRHRSYCPNIRNLAIILDSKSPVPFAIDIHNGGGYFFEDTNLSKISSNFEVRINHMFSNMDVLRNSWWAMTIRDNIQYKTVIIVRTALKIYGIFYYCRVSQGRIEFKSLMCADFLMVNFKMGPNLLWTLLLIHLSNYASF